MLWKGTSWEQILDDVVDTAPTLDISYIVDVDFPVPDVM